MTALIDTYAAVLEGQTRLVWDVIGLLSAQHDPDTTGAHWADDLQLREERVALQARELVRAVDKLPAEHQPVGWTTP